MLHILSLTTKFNNMYLRFNNTVNTKNSTIPLKKIKIQGYNRVLPICSAQPQQIATSTQT